MENGDKKEGKGKGTDLVITVLNKLSNETIVLDPSKEGEQFILTMAKANSEQLYLAKSCSTKLLVDHLLNIIEENKMEFALALTIASTVGIFDPKTLRNIKAHKIELGGDLDDEIPGLPGFGDDNSGKPPTFN